MTPIPLTETQMAELFRLRAENATLQTEIAELRIRMNAYQQAWNSDELEKSLSVENAALKAQVEHIKEIEFPTKCVAIANIWKNKVTLLDETIAQQAEAIRLKNEALFTAYTTFTEYAQIHSAKQPPDTRKSAFNFDRANQMNAAITIQPSPDILQARDERVAEACANLVSRFISGDGILNDTWVHEIEDEILSGEWRKYL